MDNTAWWRSLLDYVEAHPQLPRTLSRYVELGVRFFWACCTVWAVWAGCNAVQGDRQTAAMHATAQALTQITRCAQAYHDYGCSQGRRQLEHACLAWTRCINMDLAQAAHVGNGRALAATLNDFVHALSFSSWLLLGLVLVLHKLAVPLVNAGTAILLRETHHPPLPPTWRIENMPHPEMAPHQPAM
ncbi:Di-sulfide bridge nucleocytoplasmic transport domain-containing protein [Phyllosticta citribraziliensis]|uniref:Di-sulfide bridge nucleocytoplasmic transport domain-containing protein n=1 Tax=Phyllosticta citribraziliensis TaxID=989973 RepID=A0ABR1LZI0_9PEZI